MQMTPSTQAELLRAHEKSIQKLQQRPAPLPQVGNPMTPSQVNGGGISIDSIGQVLFSNASGTSFDIRDIFTTDWDDYLIYFDVYTSSAAMTFSAQLRTAAGAYGSAQYRWGKDTKTFSGSPTSTWTAGLAATSLLAAFGGSSGLGGGALEATIFAPNRSGTEVKYQGTYVDSAGLILESGWVNSTVGMATGLRLIPSSSSATFSGAFRCYGINHV